ncbi:hypothetical protein Bpfe_005859 [Biomphalaria pfeifferi]|uniref:Uncharacterized protein n=1 Tax=Biomphalaria pfeifferi TaxID=112525 RepID=A0AAD8C3H6_BIOPF|nr:hypothetical protein Bpfe_005859 [Biomphalaria pfeifferi]
MLDSDILTNVVYPNPRLALPVSGVALHMCVHYCMLKTTRSPSECWAPIGEQMLVKLDSPVEGGMSPAAESHLIH